MAGGPGVLAAVLYPLTFPVCEEAVYSQKVIYSDKINLIVKENFLLPVREEAKGKIPALGAP